MIALACAPKPDGSVDSTATVAPSPPPPVAAPTTSAPRASAQSSVPAPAQRPGTPQQPATSDIPAEDLSVVVAPKLSQVDTTITLRANGTELIFDPATITLKQGTRVRLRLANMGTFAHNFILVRDESDIDQLAERARDASESVPLSLKSKMVVYSNIAQPTKTVETAFVVPPPGDYTYVCLVEGHANTMIGKLRSTP